MDSCSIDQAPAVKPWTGWRFWREASAALMRGFRANAKLDLETMTDYMKRDMGFLDGRDPRYDDTDHLLR
jgi:hypothetical protein